MTKPLVVSIPHQLGTAEAQRRLRTGIEQIKDQYAGKFALLEDRWTGPHLDFRLGALGQTVTGKLDITDDHVTLAVELPWMLAMLAEKAQNLIRSKGQLLLEKK
jgi:hypothetical protein